MSKDSVVVRASREDDHDAILRLIAANSAAALTEEQRRSGGFLQGNFDRDVLRAMEASTGIYLAEIDGALAGLVCSSASPPATGGAIAAMLAELPRLHFAGRPVTDQRCTVYGPVVVDAAFRGRGVASALLAGLRRALAGRIDVGVLFVEDTNTHSLAVHTEGLGMTRIGGFAVDGRPYSVLAFDIPAAASRRPADGRGSAGGLPFNDHEYSS